jgi:hypothetical protein
MTASRRSRGNVPVWHRLNQQKCKREQIADFLTPVVCKIQMALLGNMFKSEQTIHHFVTTGEPPRHP